MKTAGKEYGEALYSLAADERCEDEVLESLELVRRIFEENPDYVRLLSNPAVKVSEHIALLDEAFRSSIHPYVLNFVKILCEKSALDIWTQCIEEYTARLYAARGILPVTAISAVPLDDKQKSALAQKLEKATGKSIRLTCRVDASLIGGIKVRYEDKELDGTIAGRLSAVRQALMS